MEIIWTTFTTIANRSGVLSREIILTWIHRKEGEHFCFDCIKLLQCYQIMQQVSSIPVRKPCISFFPTMQFGDSGVRLEDKGFSDLGSTFHTDVHQMS